MACLKKLARYSGTFIDRSISTIKVVCCLFMAICCLLHFFFFICRTVLKENYHNFYFRVKEIRILFDFCLHCNHTQKVFLEEFSKIKTSSFCIAHVFTFRDFPAGIQGLAYKGTICDRKLNTGFTTFLNHKVKFSFQN